MVLCETGEIGTVPAAHEELFEAPRLQVHIYPLPFFLWAKIVQNVVSSGLCCCMALLEIDFSEESVASIIRVERHSKLETTLAVTGNYAHCEKSASCSETSVLTISTGRRIPEDGVLHSNHRENLKSYIILTGWAL
jgi:hypothetical protein